jgi:hypothetical protein
MGEVSGYVNETGRINDVAKARLVTSGAMLGFGLTIGGVGLFARLATTVGSFLRNAFRRNQDQNSSGNASGAAAVVNTLTNAQRLQGAYGKQINTPPGTHPAANRNDGAYGERVGLQTLENETGMKFTPLQNPSGHGGDGIHIDADPNVRTIYVAEVKSSQHGLSNAQTAQGNAATKLDVWAGKSAGS